MVLRWPPCRRRRHRPSTTGTSAEALVAARGTSLVPYCLPARDEAATVGAIVDTIRTRLVDDVPLVDELLVVDDHSSDRTAAAVAADAGAAVVRTTDGQGKGEALWTRCSPPGRPRRLVRRRRARSSTPPS